MKASRIVVCVMFFALMIFGWGGYLGSLGEDNREYSSALDEARSLADKQLYVKSLQSYASALSISGEDESVWKEYVDTCRMAYEEGSYAWGSYVEGLRAASYACTSNLDFWRELLNEMKSGGSSSDAYDCAVKAVELGITDEEILETAYKIIYGFRYIGMSYKEIVSSPEGITAVNDGEYWGLLDREGEQIYSLSYRYIGPYGSEGQILLVTDKWKHVVNESGIAQTVVFDGIKSSLAYGNGYIPLQREDGSWYYLNCTDGSESEQYKEVSSFINGTAAVKKETTWQLIDETLSPTGDNFDNIKIHRNGACTYSDVMIASKGGKYSVYSGSGIKQCEFSADDMDLYMGSLIAYKDSNGLWGYVSLDGQIVIQPQFENAKSFSSGLGAVYKNGSWGFINESGRVVIDYQFEDVGYFNNSGCCFVDSGGWQMIELNNN